MKRFTLGFLVLAAALAQPGLAAERDFTATDRFPAPPGKKLVADTATLDINVRSADVRQMEVTTDLHIAGVGEERAVAWIIQHTPSLEDAVDELVVSAQPNRSRFFGIGLLTARARMSFIVPHSTVPDLTTTRGTIAVRGDFPDAAPLRLRSSTGDMELHGASHSLDIRTASGDSHIEVVRPLEKLFARSSSGDLTLIGGARAVHVDTASGDLWLGNLSGPVEIETSTGKVTLRWDRLDPNHTVKVRTSSGRVTLVLPPDASPQGTLSTTTGNIKSEFPGVIDDDGTGVSLKGDGPTLTIETASGEILLSQSGEEWPFHLTPDD